jgi:multidrug efflux pump subunit AcrA (membrane-fusion protein)
MKSVYLDKKERIRSWHRVPRLAAAAVIAGLILFAPLWRRSVPGRFVLEPVRRAFVRAEVPGKITAVFAQEGDAVAAGAVLARLHNLALESQAAQALADFQLASARATQAQLRYGPFGAATHERLRLAEQSRTLNEQVAKLQLVTPVSGTVVTPRMRDALGSYVQAGTLIAEVADLSQLRVRVYVPESSMREVRQGADASVKLDALVGTIPGQVVSIAPASTEIELGLVPAQEYRGIRPPAYYAVTVVIGNVQGSLREGMSGTAKIFSRRRSLAGFAWQEVRDFLGRKIW